jgi:hypothetical protein
MSLPDHQIWQELENYFRTRIINEERTWIVEVIRKALTENPQLDLDQLTLKAAEVVLKSRPDQRAQR